MKHCPSIACVFMVIVAIVAIVVLGSRLVLGDERQAASWVVHPEPAAARPAGGREAPPLAQLALGGAEAIERGTPLQSPQQGSLPMLTLDDLEQTALQFNPTLVQAAMAVRAAQGGYVQAGLYPNPSIRYIGDEAGNGGFAGQQGAGLGQEIVTGGKLRLARAVAGHEVQQARYGWETQRRRVLNDVRAGYYEVLLAEKMMQVNQELVRIGEEGVEVAEKLRPMEVSEIDVLQARILAERAKLSLEVARTHHRIAWRRLAAVLGRPEIQPAPLAGDLATDLPALSWEDAFARLLAESPEIGRARAGVERARCELALQCARRRPNLEIEAAGKYDHSTQYAIADVSLSLPLPLFNRNQGNIIRAQAGLIAAQNEVRRVELDLHDRFAAAFGRYANARRQVDTYTRTILPNAKESLRLIGILKQEGELGYLTLLTAQRTFFSVSLEHLASLRELWARTVEIEGMLLSGGLRGQE